MDQLEIQDVGPPDEPASVGTLEGDISPDEQIISEENLLEDSSDDISDDLKSEMEAAIESNPNDSDLVKKLRGLVKTKYDDFQSRYQTEVPKDVDLLNGLFEFDTEKGTPTTRNFATKLAQKDINLAFQVIDDLSSMAMDENGFTLGHKFLEQIGLDPYKLEELRQFSRGEIKAEDYGMVAVPPGVPREFSEAYKSLDQVSRTDVDIYLDSEMPGQKEAALRMLRDRQANLDYSRAQEQRMATEKANFESDVFSATETELGNTYQGVLTALKTNPAYEHVAISADKAVDTMVKDSIIANLNALGDPRSVLAKQAVSIFESQGVKIDTAQIESLMQTIENATKTAISAEKIGKAQGRDYSTQIQEALARKSTAIAKLTALGNKYFSQTLAKLSGVNSPDPKSGLPKLDGKNTSVQSSPTNRPMTNAELDETVRNIARSLQASA